MKTIQDLEHIFLYNTELPTDEQISKCLGEENKTAIKELMENCKKTFNGKNEHPLSAMNACFIFYAVKKHIEHHGKKLTETFERTYWNGLLEVDFGDARMSPEYKEFFKDYVLKKVTSIFENPAVDVILELKKLEAAQGKVIAAAMAVGDKQKDDFLSTALNGIFKDEENITKIIKCIKEEYPLTYNRYVERLVSIIKDKKEMFKVNAEQCNSDESRIVYLLNHMQENLNIWKKQEEENPVKEQRRRSNSFSGFDLQTRSSTYQLVHPLSNKVSSFSFLDPKDDNLSVPSSRITEKLPPKVASPVFIASPQVPKKEIPKVQPRIAIPPAPSTPLSSFSNQNTVSTPVAPYPRPITKSKLVPTRQAPSVPTSLNEAGTPPRVSSPSLE